MAYLILVVLAGVIIVDVAVELTRPKGRTTEQQDRRAMLRAIERIERKP